MPDGLDEPRPVPFFCSGHSFLPNGMLGVFGGNLGGNGGTGAKLSLVFDPWTETWTRNPDMSVGRWYPSVVTGADGRDCFLPVPDRQRVSGSSEFWVFCGQSYRRISVADGSGHPDRLVDGDRTCDNWASLG
ncbi:hypothetical protein [Kitasatospora sp. NPDC059160]|uniref:hypothetical protein n=1 Tax=unclassified Kitasatospora TaxID=2633591 RepID=UPI0036A343BE